MREFLYYSKNAVTAGNLIRDDLMKAGRLDIACNVLISAFFLSHDIREDTKVHLVFDGPPDAPKYLTIFPGKNLEGIENRIDISKKDVAGLLKKMLYKYKKGQVNEIAPGYTVEKKSLGKVLEEFSNEGKTIYILDKKGEDIREIDLKNDCVFILGDQDGIPKQEMKRIKHLDIKKISVSPKMLFASHVVTIVNNELDRKL